MNAKRALSCSRILGKGHLRSVIPASYHQFICLNFRIDVIGEQLRDCRDNDDTTVPGRAARGAGPDSPPVAPAADDGVLDGRAGQGPNSTQ